MEFDVWKQSTIMNGLDKLKTVSLTTTNTETTIEDLKKLSGVTDQVIGGGSNISLTGNEKGQLMKQHNINPGSPEWFKLWFGRPYWFKESPNR